MSPFKRRLLELVREAAEGNACPLCTALDLVDVMAAILKSANATTEELAQHSPAGQRPTGAPLH